MDELTPILLFGVGIVVFVSFIIGVSVYDYITPEHIIKEGFVVDTEYSQSGFGSSDVTVIYFDDNSTFIIYDTVEVPRNTYVRITLDRHAGYDKNIEVNLVTG